MFWIFVRTESRSECYDVFYHKVYVFMYVFMLSLINKYYNCVDLSTYVATNEKRGLYLGEIAVYGYKLPCDKYVFFSNQYLVVCIYELF